MHRILIFYLLLIAPLFAKGVFRSPFGIYVNQIYNIDLNKSTYDVIASVWWDTPEANPTKTRLKVVNSIDSAMLNTNFMNSKDKKRGIIFAVLKIRANADCDTKNYPFDQHRLYLTFENDFYTADEFAFYDSGTTACMLNDIAIDGWKVMNSGVKAEPYAYPTTFGNEKTKAKESKYSRITYEIKIKRSSPWYLFFQEYFGFYLGFLILLIAFSLRTDAFDTKVSVSLASLFIVYTAQRFLANKIVYNSFSLVDAISISSYLAIFSSMFVFIIVNFIESDSRKRAWTTVFGLIIGTTYILYNAAVVLRAYYNLSPETMGKFVGKI